MSFIDLQLLSITASQTGTLKPLYMWGDNTYGQLGDSKSQTNFSWNQIYSGSGSHSFAIRSDYTLWGWGLNNYGQLGDNTTVNKSSPVQIGIDSWTMVSVGSSHTIGISNDGKLYGWGFNKQGQLGDNTTVNKSNPVFLKNASWSLVTAGLNHSVAITSNGQLYTWGQNNSGQLGDGTVNYVSSPVQIATDTLFDSASAGKFFTTAISTDYFLYLWGDNTYSQLGDSTTITRSSPVQISDTDTFNVVSAGNSHALVINSDYKLLGWGHNLYGQIGNNPTLTGNYYTQVAEGEDHILAIRNDGLLFAWGNNNVGQLGDNTTIVRSVPVQIGSSSFVNIDAGLSYSAAIDVNGRLYTWGINQLYQLGNGTTINRSSPVQIGTDSWSQVNTGKSHAFAIGKNYELFGWGDNTYGQIGAPDIIGTSWTSIAFGTSHALGIRNDGLLFTWGLNNSGQLGNNLTTNRSSPVQIGTDSWTYISAGASHSMAIRTDGTLWTWGLNSNGQLGISLTTNRSSPVQVAGSYNFIAAGGLFSLATTSDSLLYGWGLNSSGQLGNNLTTNRSSPVQVGTSSWSQLSAGTDFSLAIKSDSTLYAWGNNNVGQLAQNDLINRSNPIQITGSYNIVSAGASTAYAIQSGSTYLYGWGLNDNGQLLTGTPSGYASYYFNGSQSSGNFATVEVNGATLPSNTGLFTIEVFVYITAYFGIDQLFFTQESGLGQDIKLGQNDGYIFSYWANRTASTTRLSLNTWYHLAFVRTSTTQLKAYIDGVLTFTYNNPTYSVITVANSCIGPKNSFAGLLNTYMSNLRITNIAVYTGNFTVPTGPYGLTQAAGTNITQILSTNVTLLTLQSSQLIDSSTNTYTLTLTNFATNPNAVTFNTIYPSSFPAPASNFSTASVLSTSSYTNVNAGLSHIVVQDINSVLYTWGLNISGQLGDGTIITRSSPVQLGSYSLITSGNKGSSTVGEVLGALFIWGNNVSGQLGVSLTINRSSPVQVYASTNSTSYTIPVRVGLSSFSQVSAGYSHTAAITIDYLLYTWGLNNNGQLGISLTTNRSSPVQVAGSWTKVDTGELFTIAIDNTQTVYTWGLNSSGQLGINLTTNRSSPVQISSNQYFTDIVAGMNHSVAMTNNNVLYAWGNNTYTQLGNNDSLIMYRSSPTQIASNINTNDARYFKISSYDNSTSAIDNFGNLYGWGDNSYAIFKQPTQYYSWTQISNGEQHSLAIRSDGRLFTWGLNTSGQLGTSDTVARSSPTQITATAGTATISNWTSVSAGSSHSTAISSTGYGYTWGLNSNGQLGDGTTVSKSSPVLFGASTTVYSIQFNGSTQYLSVADNSVLRIGTSTFTLQFYVYFTTAPTTEQVIISHGPNVSGSGRWQLGTVGSGDSKLKFSYDASSSVTFNTSLTSGIWYNIALVRDGSNVLTCYINGISETTTGSVSSDLNDTNSLYIAAGYGGAGQYLGGYINNLRFIIGSALYSSSFNIDPAPLSNITNTQLLVFTDGTTVTDNSNNNFTISNVGSITTSSSISPFNYYTAQFNNSNQYLVSSAQTSSTYFGTGSFTVECWIYLSSTPNLNDAIISVASDWQISWQSANGFIYSPSSTTNEATVKTGPLSLTTWYHIALVRTSGTTSTRMYVNGVQKGSTLTTDTYNYNSTGAFSIGRNRGGTAYFGGYITNLRIVKGVVYSGNFTPPTNLLRIKQPAGTNIAQLTGSETILLTLQDSTIVDNSTFGFTFTNNGSVTPASSVQPFLSTGEGAPGSFQAIELSAGNNYTLAIKNNYSLYAWGLNNTYQLGYNDTISRSSPVQISSSSHTQVSTGGSHALAIKSTGALFGWGLNNVGQVGVTLTPFSWTKINSGNNHTMALRSDNMLYGWGYNTAGQLGLGDTIARSSPVLISTSSWTNVVAGMSSTYAIRSDGGLFVWGENDLGQLGLNDTINRSNPVQVGNSSWSSVQSTNVPIVYPFVMGISSNGSLYGWGSNLGGQLVTNDTLFRSSPVQITSGGSYTQIAPSSGYVLALRQDGLLYSWGTNGNGELGQNDTISRSSPVQLGFNLISQIAVAGSAAYSIRTNGTLWAWGDNSSGQLGSNLASTVKRSSPVQIGAATNWTKLSTNVGYVYGIGAAINNVSQLYVWGTNGNGELGINDRVNRSSPVQVTGSWSSIASGSQGLALINTVGQLFTTGVNTNGELGINTTTNRSSPVQVSSSNSFTMVAGNNNTNSENFYLGLATDGTLWSWGGNSDGSLGLNDTISRSSPVQLGTDSWSFVASGYGAVYGIRNNLLYGWGKNLTSGLGLLGLNDTIARSSPVQITTGATSYSIVWTSGFLTTALSSTGDLYEWGRNQLGQLGLNDTTDRSLPVLVGQVPTTWNSVSVGTSHVIGIRSNNTLYGWGINANGELGLNLTSGRSIPIQIGIDSWSIVAAGDRTSAAIRSDGRLFTWGLNTSGQLGTSDTVARSSPVQVGTSSWTNVVSGGTTFFALSDNLLYGWGSGDGGQLGLSSTTNRSNPTQIANYARFTEISSGWSNGFAIDTEYLLWAWGLNSQGQLGTNDIISRSSPVQVGSNNLPTYVSVPTSLDSNSYTQISAGNSHSTAIDNLGRLYTWGYNVNGQLGYVGGFTSISAGANNDAVVREDGTLWIWGINNYGQLGQNDVVTRSSPIQVGTRIDWSKTSKFNSTSIYAINNLGKLYAWGYNLAGNLGLNDTINRSSPVQVGNSSWSMVVSNRNTTTFVSTYAIRSDGALFVWGENRSGLLGLGDTLYRSSPTQLGTSSYTLVTGGVSFASAITSDGKLFSWGDNTYGQLGITPTPISWTKITTGFSHALAVRSDNTLFAWGYNANGQLGTSDSVNRSSPVQIATQVSNVFAGTLGTSYFIKTDGTLYAMGDNSYGVIGINDTLSRSSPVQVGTSSWTNIQLGSAFNVAGITNDGKLFVWGQNQGYSLGLNDDSIMDRSSPVQLGSSSWISIAAGGTWLTIGFMLGITSTNSLYGWGLNDVGQLGFTQSFSWTQITATKGATLTATYGLRNDGLLFSWGSGTNGQLGVNQTISRSSPVQIGASSWSMVSAGENNNVYAIRNDGMLFAWGSNIFGQLGLSDTINRSSPTQVGTSSWSTVSAGASFALAITTDGKLFSWGNNTRGKLGDYSPTAESGNRSSPVQVGTSSWTSVSCGTNHVLAINQNGTLWVWGGNDGGQLGLNLPTTGNRSQPVQLDAGSWSMVEAAVSNSYAIKSFALYGWGINGAGNVGDNTTISRSSPVQLGTSSWSMVAASYRGQLALHAITVDNKLFAWVANTNGQLGTNDLITRSSPTQIGSSTTWNKTGGGFGTISGQLYGWGYNTDGQIGIGLTTNRSSPTQVGTTLNTIIPTPTQVGNSSWTLVSAQSTDSSAYSYGIKSDSTLYSWGSNESGQLGLNDRVNRSSPVQVGTSSWTIVQALDSSAIGIDINSRLFTWGLNTSGMLGLGDTIARSSPVQIGTSSFSVVTSGNVGKGFQSYAIDINSRLFAWGDNAVGALGQNTTTNRSSPVQVGTNQSIVEYNPVQVGNSSWIGVAAGPYHTLGITSANELYSWGLNNFYQLGLNDNTNRSSPTQVGSVTLTNANAYSLLFNGTTQYISVASNAAFDFGTNNFTIECWFNTSTVTGTQVLIDRWNFGTTIFLLRISGASLNGWVSTSGTSNIIGGTVQVNVWNHAAFVRNGSVITLYLNGISVGTPINTALAITTGTSVVAIGGHGSEGIFGYVSNARIVNGTAVYTTSFTPSTTPLTAITNTSLLTAQNTTIVDNSTNAFTITNNGSVSFSISTPFTSALPSGAFAASIVSAGESSSMAIDTNQNLYLWGANIYGSGFNDVITRSRPTQIVGSDKFTNISGGAFNSLALTSSNILYTWGYNNNGQLGINDTINRSSPVQITSLSLVNRNSPTQITSSSYSLVSAGFNTSYAVKSDNILTVWGLNSAGQLGLSDRINRSSPTQINTSIIQISAGGSHASTVDSTTLLEAWGQNTNGQLGISLTTGRSSPVQVSAITTITASSPTLLTSGSYDNYYQSSPVQIGSSSWSLISAGTNTSLGMLANNTLFAWGQNNYGQLGTTDTINRSSPVQIASGSFTHINAGENFSSLRKNDYSIYLFGENDVGQIGDLT